MKASAAVVVAIVLAGVGVALAQVGQIGRGGNYFTPASLGYQGPGDLVPSALGWWGLRAFSAAKAAAHGNIAIITRASDSTTCTVVSDSNGNLDLVGTPCAGSTTIGTWCNATTCRVTTLHDQSSAAHNLALGTTGPTLTFNCINTSLPCMTWPANTINLTTGSVLGTVNQPYSFSLVAQRTGNFTTLQKIMGSSGTISFSATANAWVATAGSNCTATGINDSTWHAVQVYFNGANPNSFINFDGTDWTCSGSGTGSSAQGTSMVFGGGGTGVSAGLTTEGGLWGTTTVSDRAALCHNQRVYWGLTGTC